MTIFAAVTFSTSMSVIPTFVTVAFNIIRQGRTPTYLIDRTLRAATMLTFSKTQQLKITRVVGRVTTKPIWNPLCTVYFRAWAVVTAALETNERPLLKKVFFIMTFATKVRPTLAPLVTFVVMGISVMTAFIEALTESETK